MLCSGLKESVDADFKVIKTADHNRYTEPMSPIKLTILSED
jgi:hypothetical protein